MLVAKMKVGQDHLTVEMESGLGTLKNIVERQELVNACLRKEIENKQNKLIENLNPVEIKVETTQV